MSAPSGSELSHSSVGLLDRALEVLRRTSGNELRRALGPGLGLAFLALALYYAERVEGVRALRGPFAVAFAALYLTRAVVLARWAGRRAEELLAPYRVEVHHGPTSLIVRTAGWVFLDLWFWLWLLVLALHVDPWAVPAVLPLFAVRGALVPGWLACADGTVEGSGFGVLKRALEQAENQRGRGMALELLCLLGALGVAVNLLALGAGAVSVGQDMLGLDLAFVSAFLSHDNHFALLFVLGLSMALFEPLRAAASAVSYSEALLTREGIALRALVVRAEERGPGRRAAAALLLLCALFRVAEARAQEEPLEDAGVVAADIEEPCDEVCQRARAADGDVQERVEAILAEPAFAEFPEADWSDDAPGKNFLSRWLDELFEWLGKGEERKDESIAPSGVLPAVNLPGATFFIVLALLFVVGALVAFALRSKAPLDPPGEAPAEVDPLTRPAEAHLEEARALASVDLSAALRSLYLATLVGLERRGLLALSPERTNGQYLRSLPRGDERTMFGSFTRVFDSVHYGGHPPSRDDFDTCRGLAERLVAGEKAP